MRVGAVRVASRLRPVHSHPAHALADPWALLPISDERDAFRLMMREPARSQPGCSSPEWPGAQLCHTSCFRQMARGDAELLRFVRNSSGHVTSMVAPGVGVECKKVG